MSDFLGLGPMLGMSPPWLALGQAEVRVADYDARIAWAKAGLAILDNATRVRAVIWQPPAPEPGITWQPTGGKTWRVTITR